MMQYESGIMGKWLAMLKEVAPRLTRVAFIANPKFRGYEYFWRSAEPAAQAIAVELIPSQISNNAADIEHAIESFAQMPDGGLLFVPDATIIAHRNLVITCTARSAGFAPRRKTRSEMRAVLYSEALAQLKPSSLPSA
jgi:putative ABC transport system substrate-binding protein